MPFVVSSFFYRCDDVDYGGHGVHFTLKEAVDCLNELARDGDVPIHPITGKYMQAIFAVDGNGDSRDFTKKEKRIAKALGLDPKSVVTEKQGIITFGDIAEKCFEALRLLPISAFDLEQALDYRHAGSHFWTTDAGIGQALFHTQQTLFTLELSLKAVLEVLGKLTKGPQGKRPNWQTHDLIVLFELLEEEHKNTLERWWANSPASERQYDGTLKELLTSVRNSYGEWRYIPQLKDAPSINIGALQDASRLLLRYERFAFKQTLPIKVTSRVDSSQSLNGGTAGRVEYPAIIEGVVRRVKIHGSYDPFGEVEVVIDSDHHAHDVTTKFCLRDAESYYGLEGERVTLGGWSYQGQPSVLYRPYHIGLKDKSSSYTSEYRTLKGSVYNLKVSETAYRVTQAHLILKDETFFSEVDCLFITSEERDKLDGVQLGEDIFISGIVTLLNGRPIRLVGPDKIERIESMLES